jgi:hypothetical protein
MPKFIQCGLKNFIIKFRLTATVELLDCQLLNFVNNFLDFLGKNNGTSRFLGFDYWFNGWFNSYVTGIWFNRSWLR